MLFHICVITLNLPFIQFLYFLGAWKEKFFLRIVGCRMPVWRYDTNWIKFYEVGWKVNLHEKVTMIARKTRMRVNGGKGEGKRSKQLSPTSAADIPTGCSVTFDRYPLFHIFHCSSIQGHGNGRRKNCECTPLSIFIDGAI